MEQERIVCFVLLRQVHLMDLAGPAQAFYEASSLGSHPYRIVYCSVSTHVRSEQGLVFSDLILFSAVRLKQGDFIFIPGIDFKAFTSGELDQDIEKLRPWLKHQSSIGVQIASVCTGALVLAATGLLNRKKCTCHWKCIDYMKERFPLVYTLTDRLFVNDGGVYSSAGMTSGIDMALSILEKIHGPILSAKVAREMVVYMRRNSTDTQQTIYLDYRTHFNPAIHVVQDYIISNPAKNPGLEELASVSNTSVRNLTRLFKKATGHSIIEFKNAVKIELARTLLHNNEYTMEKISSLCGFQSARHFRRILANHTGASIAPVKNLKEDYFFNKEDD